MKAIIEILLSLSLYIINIEGNVFIFKNGEKISQISEFPYFISDCEILTKEGHAEILSEKDYKLIKIYQNSEIQIKGGKIIKKKGKVEEKILGVSNLKGELNLIGKKRIGGFVMRQKGAEIECLYPASNIKIKETRPVFRFKARDTCKLLLFEGDRDSLIFIKRAIGNELKFPSDFPELERGKMYVWELRRGFSYDEGIFYVASDEEIKAVESIMEAVERLSNEEKYLIAIRLENSGFYKESLKIYKNIKNNFDVQEKIRELEDKLKARREK